MKDSIVERVINKISSRSDRGISKYGTTLHDNNKDNYLQHLQEELFDASLYIEKLMYFQRELTEMVKNHPNDTELGMAVRKMIS
jgi:hypothetical protein